MWGRWTSRAGWRLLQRIPVLEMWKLCAPNVLTRGKCFISIHKCQLLPPQGALFRALFTYAWLSRKVLSLIFCDSSSDSRKLLCLISLLCKKWRSFVARARIELTLKPQRDLERAPFQCISGTLWRLRVKVWGEVYVRKDETVSHESNQCPSCHRQSLS